jgi:hypothetical protein
MYVHNAAEVAAGAKLSAVPVKPWHSCDGILGPTGQWISCGMCNGVQMPEQELKTIEVVWQSETYPFRGFRVGHTYAIQDAPNRAALCRRTLKTIRRASSDNVYAVDLEAMAWPIEASIYDDPCDIVDAIQDAQQAFRNAFPDDVWLLEWQEE